MRSIASALSLCLAWFALAPSGASAQDDYSTSGDAWNAISALIRLADEQQLSVDIPHRLDIGTVSPNDALLILNPQHELPADAITALLRAGGRVCLADDFGSGEALLALFSIVRHPPAAGSAMRLRGNVNLLVARPNGGHRLTQGVRALVSNHPSVVSHPDLTPIFELTSGEAIVLSGAVGEGRLVVLSDPSVLINNMMTLRANRRFGQNLLEYLAGGRSGRLIVVRPGVRVVGQFGEPGADRPLHGLRASLERIGELELPPAALRIASAALAAIAALLALGALPRRSPYRAQRMFAREAAHGGFIGRVGFFSRPGTNLLLPLMVYKFEFEAEVLRRFSLGGRTLLRDVVSTMRARGLSEHDIEDMRTLLLTLDQLHADQDRPASPPVVAARRFRELVARGDRLLERIAR